MTVQITGKKSNKKYTIQETSPGKIAMINENDSVVLLEADATSIKDAGGVQLSSHGSRHAKGGADAIPDDGLGYSQIKVSFGTQQSVTVAAGSTAIIPEGVYIVRLGANTVVEYSPDGGSTWYQLIPAGSAGIIFSDGANVRLNNTGSEDETSYLLPIV